MVFAKLSVQEKDAFFGLLDEYFQSRPEIFGQSGDGGSGISTAAAASVVQRALAANTTPGPHASTTPKSNNPYAMSVPSVDVAQAMSVGRVAAASLAFSGGPSQTRSTSSLPLPIPSLSLSSSPKPNLSDAPPSLPRRTPNPPAPTSTTLGSSAAALVPGAQVDKLITQKGSVFSAFKKPPTAGVVIPPAFVAPKGAFGPPPVRRVTSETSSGGGGGAVQSRYQSQAAPGPEPEPEVAHGEWAEVLYEYSSEDPGDLAIKAGTRVLVTAKSSEDWWTGQIEGQGREGLFPASYVELV